MDFQVQIGTETQTFDQYHQALAYIDQKMASWNNFLSDEPLYIVVKKVPNNTETLGVQTAEKIDLKAIFGRP